MIWHYEQGIIVYFVGWHIAFGKGHYPTARVGNVVLGGEQKAAAISTMHWHGR